MADWSNWKVTLIPSEEGGKSAPKVLPASINSTTRIEYSISWDEALTEVAGRLKKLRDDGHPEKFMFHYGRMKASSSKIVKSVFLGAYGTKTVGNHTSICEGGKWTAQELTWGKHYDNWDFDNTKFVINFGSGVLEAHTNHIPASQRLVDAMVDRGVKVYTFDVRLSNTAAKSTEWVPIKPGTDGAVAMAMCNVIMQAGLYDKKFFKYIKATKNRNASTDEKIATLKKHSSLWPWSSPRPNRPASSATAVLWLISTAMILREPSRRWLPSPATLTTPAAAAVPWEPSGSTPRDPRRNPRAKHSNHQGLQGRRRLPEPWTKSPGSQDDQGRQGWTAGSVHVVLLHSGLCQR
jgi:hypothetical protein